MKWIRTGQVRVNKKRAKPFDRLAAGDSIRIPPYRAVGDGSTPELFGKAASAEGSPGAVSDVSLQHGAGDRIAYEATGLTVIDMTDDILVLHKPAGIPVQPGTGHTDSIAARLAVAAARADFRPAPAHRLDKHTSGLLLVGRTYAGLRWLQKGFAEGHAIRKEYLTWVTGSWKAQKETLLSDMLVKKKQDGTEKMYVVPALSESDGAPACCEQAKQAVCSVTPLLVREEASLLKVVLQTGRTHQIRVQLASRGYPLIGDLKYGGGRCSQGLLLHAWRVTLPLQEAVTPGEDHTEQSALFTAMPFGACFSVLPSWHSAYAVHGALLAEQ